MSIFSLLGNVEKQPQARLQQMANQPGPDPLQALAAQSELLARRRGMPQPSAGGLPALPTGRAVPQRYAQGGVVAFNGEGPSQVFDPTKGTPLDAQPKPRLLSQGLSSAWQALMGQNTGGNPYSRYNDRPWFEGDRLAPPEAPPAAPGAAPPWMAQSQRPVTMPFNPAAPSAPAPSLEGTMGAGARASARGGAGSAGLQPPTWYNPLEGAPARRMTDAEFDAELAKQKVRLEKLYGPDVTAEIIAEIVAEREKLTKKYDTNKNEALLQAGAAMMAGKSQHGLINIGEGITKGLGALQSGRDRLDTQDQALRREANAAKMTSQGRKDLILGQSIGRTDAENANRAADRTEHMAIVQSYNQHKKDLAQFGLDSRKIDALFAEVEARRADTMQRAAQHGDEKKWRAANETWAKAFEMAMAKYKSNPMALEQVAPEVFAAEVDAFRRMISAGNDSMMDNMRGGAAPQQSYPTSRVPARNLGLGG